MNRLLRFLHYVHDHYDDPHYQSVFTSNQLKNMVVSGGFGIVL
jgi:hypothetical protein